jgi:hypothetical protein
MPRQRGYSLQTCETYAVSFKLLLEYAAMRTGTRPSWLAIEQLDAPLIVAFLAYIELKSAEMVPPHATCVLPPSDRSCGTSSIMCPQR